MTWWMWWSFSLCILALNMLQAMVFITVLLFIFAYILYNHWAACYRPWYSSLCCSSSLHTFLLLLVWCSSKVDIKMRKRERSYCILTALGWSALHTSFVMFTVSCWLWCCFVWHYYYMYYEVVAVESSLVLDTWKWQWGGLTSDRVIVRVDYHGHIVISIISITRQ